MSHTIRFANARDAAVIHALIVELAVYEKEPDAVEATPESLAAQLTMPKPPFECLLLEAEGQVHGMALFFHNYSTWRGKQGLYLEDLYVVPSARGRGFGLALLARLASIALERDCPRMEWAVLNWNAPAIAFYEALGAESLSGWTINRLSGQALAALASRAT